jgi:hypothetical protein
MPKAERDQFADRGFVFDDEDLGGQGVCSQSRTRQIMTPM